MKLVQITEIDGSIVCINAEQIIAVKKGHKVHGNPSIVTQCTMIQMSNGTQYSIDGSVEDFFIKWRELWNGLD